MNIASIDIGSNTVLLLIAEINKSNQTTIPLLNELRMPRISQGINESGIISNHSVQDLLNVISEYKNIINNYNCEKILVNATQALRVAKNGDEIIRTIKSKFGFNVEVISGNKEAYYSYLGAVSGFEINGNSVVIDIGGASTEIISGNNETILFQKSFPVGVVTMTEKYLMPVTNEENVKNLEVYLEKIFSTVSEIDSRNSKIIAVAGTPSTLAALKQNLSNYSESKVEGFKLYESDLNDFINVFKSMSPEEILNKYGQIINGRQDIILAGTIILKTIINLLGQHCLYSSSRGLRYGAIIDFKNSTNWE